MSKLEVRIGSKIENHFTGNIGSQTIVTLVLGSPNFCNAKFNFTDKATDDAKGKLIFSITKRNPKFNRYDRDHSEKEELLISSEPEYVRNILAGAGFRTALSFIENIKVDRDRPNNGFAWRVLYTQDEELHFQRLLRQHDMEIIETIKQVGSVKDDYEKVKAQSNPFAALKALKGK